MVGWCWVAFRFFSAGRRAVRPVVRVCRCLLVLVDFGKDGEPGLLGLGDVGELSLRRSRKGSASER